MLVSSFHTVSINVFSTLLKRTMPKNKITAVKEKLYSNPSMVKVPLPNKTNRYASTKGESGFISIAQPNPFVCRKDMGYTMGVAYMSSCMPKPTNTVKSRYLVVSDDTMMPMPSAMPAKINNSTGMYNQYTVTVVG